MLFERLNEGGPTFMYPLLLILILVIILIIQSFLKKENSKKTIKLISSIALFALVWGFLGQLIGMIGGFDSIQMANEISPGVLAGGLKVSLLPPVFGMVVFLIGRLGIIVLTWMQKEV